MGAKKLSDADKAQASAPISGPQAEPGLDRGYDAVYAQWPKKEGNWTEVSPGGTFFDSPGSDHFPIASGESCQRSGFTRQA